MIKTGKTAGHWSVSTWCVHDIKRGMSSNHDAKRRKTEDGVATDVMGMESKMDRMEENLIHLKARNGQLEASLQRTKTSVSSMQNNISNFRESVENRQKYHEVILRNQKWEYSAPRPSRDYWQSITMIKKRKRMLF